MWRTAEVEYEQMLLSRHALAAYGRRGLLDRSVYVLLSLLRVKGPMSIGELSEVLGLDASTLNRQTAAAVRTGYLQRIPDPDGGIARKFLLTEAGDEALDAQRAAVVAGLDEVMVAWSDEDLAAYTAFLRRFNADIERVGGRVWPRS